MTIYVSEKFQIENSNGSNMNYQHKGFNLLTSRRPYYLRTLIKIHKNIIFSDIDAIWMKDPRPYFKGKEFDFWAQIDGVIEGSPYFHGYIPFICSGFLALKSTSKTLKMLQQWQNLTAMDRLHNQEQNTLQKVAFELGVNFGVLPVKHFPYGLIYFNAMQKKDRKDVVLLHNNYVFGKDKKIQRFKDFHLWAPDFHPNSICYNEMSKDILTTRAFQCLPDDVTLTQDAMAVHPGKILLTEKTLLKAFRKKYDNFKQDIGQYFYHASLHWKTI